MNAVVDRALRDHARYTGDGLPNEPTGAPLPLGDPASGQFTPQKADLRAAMNETIDEAAASVVAAAAAAAAASAYGWVQPDTFALLATLLPADVAVGQYVRLKDTGALYQRVSSGGDLNYTGTGGIRLAALPDIQGAISAAALANPALVPAAAGAGGVVAVPSDINAGTTAPINPGASFVGGGGLWYEGGTGGRQLANKPGRGPDVLQWGRENLVRWLEGLRTGATLKVALVGDSNTASHVGGELQVYLDSLPNVSIVNHGIGGTNIEQWRTGTGAFGGSGKALSDTLAYDPDLIVMCWGTNDPLSARSGNDFSASLIAALTTVRASLSVQNCSIALLTPITMGSVNDQDELWSLQLRGRIHAAAERFTCGFFDQSALFPNSNMDLAAGAMQYAWLDVNRVHPADLQREIMAAMIAEWLAPRELWALVWDNIPTKAAADLASTYPPGVSIARMTDGAFNGFVVTINPINPTNHFPMQIGWGLTAGDTRLAHRIAAAGVWTAWTITGADPLAVVGTILSPYSLAGGAQGLNTQRDGNMVSLNGTLNRTSGQVVTGGTVAVIGTVAHRPLTDIQDATCAVRNAGGTIEVLRVQINTAGSIVFRGTSVMTDATSVTFSETFRGA